MKIPDLTTAERKELIRVLKALIAEGEKVFTADWLATVVPHPQTLELYRDIIDSNVDELRRSKDFYLAIRSKDFNLAILRAVESGAE